MAVFGLLYTSEIVTNMRYCTSFISWNKSDAMTPSNVLSLTETNIYRKNRKEIN